MLSLTKVVEVKVPEFLSDKDVRIAAAVEAFSKGSISVGKAAEIAEIPTKNFWSNSKKEASKHILTRIKKLSKSYAVNLIFNKVLMKIKKNFALKIGYLNVKLN